MTKAELARVIVNEIKAGEIDDRKITASQEDMIDLEEYWVDEIGHT